MDKKQAERLFYLPRSLFYLKSLPDLSQILMIWSGIIMIVIH
jgi:hypothetical protein